MMSTAEGPNVYGSAPGMMPFKDTNPEMGDMGVEPGAERMYVKNPFDLQRRRRLNVVPILICFFVPWALYVGVTALLSFSLHFYQPLLCWLFVAAAVCVVIGLGIAAFWAQKKKILMEPDATPSWYMFLFLTSALAVILALIMGELNYETNARPHFNILSMDTFSGLDPGRMKGEQFMDVSMITFNNGTRLDLTHSMGFKDDDIYCVAPIINPEFVKPDRYDYWAVGLNCCSGNSADFHCEGFNNPYARSGLRLMQDSERPFYRLAVQQAEAVYRIGAPYPLFFKWVVDPQLEADGLWATGIRWFLSGLFAYFILQGFLVTVATLAFSKMSFHYHY